MSTNNSSAAVKLSVDSFGHMIVKDSLRDCNRAITRFTWTTENNLKVQVITYGATITSIQVPDRNGVCADMVLGFDNMEGYQNASNPYFGATIGRVANRINGGIFHLDGINYSLNKNNDGSHLHGGLIGFDKVNWDYHIAGTSVVLSYLSQEGEEKYPGALLTQLTYEVTSDDVIKVKMECASTKTTPVNLTNHSYFNLAGHDSGAKEIYNHVITINADKFTPTNEQLLTTGEILSVGNTVYDFRIPRSLGDFIKQNPSNGYDTNFCITKSVDQSLAFVSRVVHPKSGRAMEIYSNQPGVQFYTSNFLPNPAAGKEYKPLKGKSGAAYVRHGAFCLETQNLPNAVNYKNFPNPFLHPGEKYLHNVEYKFMLQN